MFTDAGRPGAPGIEFPRVDFPAAGIEDRGPARRIDALPCPAMGIEFRARTMARIQITINVNSGIVNLRFHSCIVEVNLPLTVPPVTYRNWAL